MSSITNALLTTQRVCENCSMPLRHGEVCLNRYCLTNRKIRRRITLQRQLKQDKIDIGRCEFAAFLFDTGRIGETG